MGGNHSTNVNDFQRIMIKSWEEIEPGRPFYLRYYGLPHAVIVTEKNENDGCIKGIHYGYQNFLRTRTISEDEFQVNLMNGNIFRLSIPEEMMVGPGVAIQRARGKIGERRFNLVSRRSSHIVTECVMK